MDNISQNDNIEKLDRELAQIQKSTRTVFSFLIPLHDRLRMSLGWYYKWHLNPVYNFVNLAMVVLVTGAVAGLIGLNIFGQTKLISHASSKQMWGSTGSWEGWTLEGTEVDLSTNSLALKKAVTEGAEADSTAKYSASGTTQISYTAYNNETVDWLSAESDVTANGQTLSTQYSTDKVLWTDDIGALADSAEISIRFSLATNDASVSPKINYLALNYSRLPNPPAGLSFEDKKIPLNHQQILHAGIFSDPDNDLQKASQWQISDKPGDFGNPIVDSGAREKGDFSAYKLDNNLNDGKYSFRVRYQDATGAWGLWSEASFFELKNQALAVSVAPGGEIPAEASEIQSKRTETTKTSFNPDGTFTLTSYTGLIHYKDNYQDPSAQWKDINPNHSIDNPEYVLFDQMPSTVKVFKDRIGYEIESRKTGDKYTVELQDVDGNPKLSTNSAAGSQWSVASSGSNGLVSWANINTPQSTNHLPTGQAGQPQTTNLAEWLLPSALADEPAVTTNDGNLKFEFQISESGVRLWKTITGPDAPKNFTWNITKTDGTRSAGQGPSGGIDDLQFRENPEAFEISSTPNTLNTPIPVSIETKKTDLSTDHQPQTTNFLWQETAPTTDLKIDTDVFYSGAGDGYVTETYTGGTSYAGAHAATAGTAFDYTGATAIASSYRGGGIPISTSTINRSFLPFDTSALPDTATISAATMSIYVTATVDQTNGDTYDYINVVGPTTQANPASLAAEDFDQDSTVTNPTTGASNVDVTGIGTGAYKDLALNASGISWISLTGTTLLGVRDGHDIQLSSPLVAETTNSVTYSTSEETGTGQDPKLAITYTLPPAGIDVAGTFYDTDESSTLKSKSLGLRVNGGAEAAATSDASDGTFIFSSVMASAGDTITIYSKDGTYKANTITITDGTTAITGANLYASHVAVSSDNGATAITNADIADWDNDDDAANMLFTDNSNNISIEAGNEFYIFASKTYTPGGTVTVEDIDINGTFVPSSNAVTVSGSWDSTDGTFTNTSSTVTFTSTTTETITSHAEIFNNLTFNGAAGTWTAQDALVTAASSTLTITAGTLDIANQNFTIGAGGTFTNNATLRLVGGTQTLTNLTIPTTAGTVEYSGTGTYTGLKAANSYYNLKINGSGGTYTLNATTDINGGITLAAGTIAADTQNMTVYGNWTVTSGLFNPGSGTVTFNGGETGGTITSNSQSFNNLTVAGIFPTFADDFSSGINQNHWVDAVPASPAVAESGMITAYETTGALYAFSGLSSLGKWLLQGDFDIQVDFDTSALPAGAEASLLGQYDGGYYSISNYGSGYNSDNMIGNDSTPGATGKLRLVRTGTNLYGYFWGGSSWTQFATASGVSTADYRVIFRTQNLLGGINALAYFDNFQVNSGTLSGTSYASWTMSDALSVANNLTISTGILTAGNNNATIGNYIQSGGTFSAPTPAGGKKLIVNGGWNHAGGTFTHNDGNVTFAGDDLIQGNTTFYDFTHATPNKTITVTAGTTQTIAGALSINGTDASNKITLVSSSPGTRWNITPQGTKSASWVTVSDSTSSVMIGATNSTEGIPSSTTNWIVPVVTHTITSSVTGSNGTISPTPTVDVNEGSNQDFIITPSEGYYISSIVIDGTSQTGALTSPYTFTNVTATHTISVSFTATSSCIWDGGGADDNWNTDANWTGNSKPTSACDVIFNNTSDDNSTIDTNFSNHIQSLSVNSGYDGTITMAKDLNDDGDFTLNSGTYTAGNYTINVGGSWATAASPTATFNANTSTVVFNATSSKNITSNSQSFNNLTFNGAGGTWTAQDALTAVGTLTLTTGTFDANGQNISIATLVASGSSTRTLDLGEGIWTVSGNWDSSGTNVTVQPRTSTVDLTGTASLKTASQSTSPYNFYNLNFGHNTKTTTLNSHISISNQITAYSGGTVAGIYDLDLYKSDGDPIASMGTANIAVSVAYLPGSSISVAGHSFANIVWFGGDPSSNTVVSLTSNLSTTGEIRVYHGLVNYTTTLDTATFNVQADRVKIGAWGSIDFGSGAHTITGNLYNSAAVNNNSSIDFGSSNISIGGSVTLTGIAVTPGTSTVTMNATTAGKTITSASQSFNNLTFNGAGGTWTLQDALDVNGNLSLANGTLAAGSNAINVAGNWTRSSGLFSAGTSTVTLDGAGGTTQTISGDTTFNNFTATASSARTLQFAGGSTTTVSGTWMVYGASGQLLTLKSTNSSDWTINPATIASPLTYHYLSVDHSINSGTPFCATYSSGTNTTGWYFSTGSSCAGAIQFSASSASGSESTTSVNIGISLPAAQPLDAYVLYAVTGGTATGGGVDYTLASGTAFIPAGSTSTTVPLTIVDDNLDEPNETIIVTLSNPTNAILGVNTTYTYSITDNDNSPTVQFNDSSGDGLESVLTPTIQVVLSQQSAYDATVNYAVTGGTATGGGVDYILNAGTLTIPAGQTYADIPITIINDALDELNESVIITLSSPVNASLGDRKIYTYTIKDDDALPQVFFTSPTSSGSESNTAVGLEISLSAVSGRDVTVNYAVVGGTATQGVDYTMPFTSVVIPTGSINAVIPLTIVDDTLVESNETIIVQLSSAVGASIVSAKNAHTYTIIDNDTTPSYIIQASAVGNGIIDPAGAITVAEHSNPKFIFIPNVGYEIASVFKDGENIDTPTSYTFIDVRENHTIVVSFRIRTFTITARSTDSGSAVTPASQVVQYGQNASISINVNAGYHLVSITDNGAIIPVYSQNIYDLSFVTENRLVLFSTAFDYYTLTINKSGNGSGVFSEQMQTVTKFSSINVTATPDDSSIFSGWTGDIISADPNIALGNFTSDVMITGEFTLKKLKIEAIRSQNGTIVPGGVVYVNYGETRKFDMAPNPGYFTSAVIVDGEPLGPLQSYTFVNISSNHTIKADFSVFQYRIQAIAIGKGSVVPEEQTIDFGADAKIRLLPEAGNTITSIVDNGVVVPIVNEYSLSDIHANHIVEIYFGQDVVPPSDSELTVTAPLPLFSEQLYANINIAWKYEGSNTDKVSRYRISYQTNTADFVILGTVAKDVNEYLWNINDSICPFTGGPGAVRVEALDENNNSLDGVIIEGSYTIPKVSVEIDPADSLSGLYEMDGGSSYQFKATTIADGLATDKKVAWQSDEEAGRFEKEGLFRARYVFGVFDNAISATVDSCGQRSMAQASLKIYAVSEPTPAETVSSTALSAGTAAAVGVTVATSVIANTASLLSLSELWNYLLMPFLLFGSRRRRENRWGRVLEEGSGLAIPMAKIALLKVEDFSKRPVATSFSDKDGYYGFVAGSGRYVIEVTKDMYHMTEIPGYYAPGREIVVTDEKQGLIVPTIIMAMTEESLKKKLNFFRNLGVYERAAIVVTWIVLLVSSIISVNNLIKYPDNPYVIGIAALNIFLWAININSLFKKSPWGKVLDRNNLAPLSLSLIRVMDPTGTRLVRTAITNEDGKFSTILPKGQYKILVAKSGYNQKEPVTLRTDDPLNLVNKKILIDKNV